MTLQQTHLTILERLVLYRCLMHPGILSSSWHSESKRCDLRRLEKSWDLRPHHKLLPSSWSSRWMRRRCFNRGQGSSRTVPGLISTCQLYPTLATVLLRSAIFSRCSFAVVSDGVANGFCNLCLCFHGQMFHLVYLLQFVRCLTWETSARDSKLEIFVERFAAFSCCTLSLAVKLFQDVPSDLSFFF